MKRFGNLGGLLLVLATLLVIYSRLPLGTALEFVEDERYEVMKAFLCSKGFILYKDIWNDQPPVHTMLLTGAFRIWGSDIFTARMVAAGFGFLLFATFFLLVRQRSSIWCALMATFLLLSSPIVLSLSSAVMLEVPAIGTTLLSALLLHRWSERPHWGWLVASGVTMGIALQIKLTAAVVGPAIVAEMALRARANREPAWWRRAFFNALWWGLPLVILFVAIGLTWGRGSLESSLKSHLASQSSSLGFSEGPASYPVQLALFLRHGECVLAAVAGLAWVIRQKRARELAFPVVLLSTVLFIHAFHRPWWNYYYLHFAVPLAWVAGWAVNEALKSAAGYLRAKRFLLSSRTTWKAIALCAFAAAVLARSEGRLEANVKQLQESPKANTSAVLAKMRRFAGATHWVCAVDVMYPFHAGLQVPPNLAVVMAKRFWSSQISTREIIDVCRQYKPEQILLTNGRIGSEWTQFLKPGYQLALADGDLVLYLSNDLVLSTK